MKHPKLGVHRTGNSSLFGTRKLALLRRFRPFTHVTPTHDHLGDILATLDVGQFQGCFVAWVAAVAGIAPDVTAIDGKTVRRSGQKNAKGAIHMVSAFATRQRVAVRQVKVTEKSNEITAIPRLLDMMAIEGAVVTIDAMGCQRDIAQKAIDEKADHVLALKGNQGALRDDVELFDAEQKARGFAGTAASQHTKVDGEHGRIETRTTTVISDVGWLQDRHGWPGLKAVVTVERCREINGKVEQETRYYITSLAMLAARLGPVVHSHWAEVVKVHRLADGIRPEGIESSLRWVLDMVIRDDECRVKTDNAADFTALKHMSLNPLRRLPGRQSIRGQRKAASWNNDRLANLITA